MSTIVLPQGIQIPKSMGRVSLLGTGKVGGFSAPYLYSNDAPGNELCDFYVVKDGRMFLFEDAWSRADYVAKVCNWVYDYSRLPWWAFIRRRRMLRQLPKQKV